MERFESKHITFEQLQAFFNDPALDLPAAKRDLSNPRNVLWLNRNFHMRNEMPEEYGAAFREVVRSVIDQQK